VRLCAGTDLGTLPQKASTYLSETTRFPISSQNHSPSFSGYTEGVVYADISKKDPVRGWEGRRHICPSVGESLLLIDSPNSARGSMSLILGAVFGTQALVAPMLVGCPTRMAHELLSDNLFSSEPCLYRTPRNIPRGETDA